VLNQNFAKANDGSELLRQIHILIAAHCVDGINAPALKRIPQQLNSEGN
jgi:hypothetical protein